VWVRACSTFNTNIQLKIIDPKLQTTNHKHKFELKLLKLGEPKRATPPLPQTVDLKSQAPNRTPNPNNRNLLILHLNPKLEQGWLELGEAALSIEACGDLVDGYRHASLSESD